MTGNRRKLPLENEDRWLTLRILGSLLAAALVQITLPQWVSWRIAGWLGQIDWLLLVTVYIGLQRDPYRALLTGAVAGVIHDAFSLSGSFGVSGAAYVVAAYLTHSITAVIVVDNLLIRFVTVSAGALAATGIRLLFYALLRIPLAILGSGQLVAAGFVFSLLVHLIVSIPFFILLDRLFLKGESLRRRRLEARRRRF